MLETRTEREKRELDEKLLKNINDTKNKVIFLYKDLHIQFIINQISKRHPICYDMMIPWICHWIVNSLYVLLGREEFVNIINNKLKNEIDRMTNQIISLQTTGFSGNRNMLPNLGCTYSSLAFLYMVNKLDRINKENVLVFLNEMKHKNGFYMHKDGESDARTTYCAIASYCIITNLKPKDYFLFKDCTKEILERQTYEGGFAANKGEEAHGGYTYCSIASLYLLDSLDKIHPNIRNWLNQRCEFGFTGRTNKLVDSCYNYWIGGSMKMLNMNINVDSIRDFTLINCQSKRGGMRDKPGSEPDLYHTHYSLVGLYSIENEENKDDFYIPLGIARDLYKIE